MFEKEECVKILFQNQIAAQQAIYVKQQQQQQQLGSGGGPADIFKSNTMHDSSINALQSNFSDLCMNKDTQMVND